MGMQGTEVGTTVSNTVLHIWKLLRVNLKSSHLKKKKQKHRTEKVVFSAEIWKLRRSLLCEILGNGDESRRKNKFKGPETELVLASLRTKDVMGVW